jgi:O-antigen/teichoic acid export membrane protein
METKQALRRVQFLVGGYVALSVLTLAAIVLLRNHPTLVTPAVWVRASIVVLASLLMTSFAVHAARGSGRSYLRLRLASAIMVVAIAVIVAIPGLFPVWLRIEQGACGLLLLGVVVIVNGKRLRAHFGQLAASYSRTNSS